MGSTVTRPCSITDSSTNRLKTRIAPYATTCISPRVQGRSQTLSPAFASDATRIPLREKSQLTPLQARESACPVTSHIQHPIQDSSKQHLRRCAQAAIQTKRKGVTEPQTSKAAVCNATTLTPPIRQTCSRLSPSDSAKPATWTSAKEPTLTRPLKSTIARNVTIHTVLKKNLGSIVMNVTKKKCPAHLSTRLWRRAATCATSPIRVPIRSRPINLYRTCVLSVMRAWVQVITERPLWERTVSAVTIPTRPVARDSSRNRPLEHRAHRVTWTS